MKKQVVIEKIRNGELTKLPFRFRNDRDVVIEFVKSNDYAAQYIPKKFLADKEIVIEMAKKNSHQLYYTPWWADVRVKETKLSKDLLDDEEIILEMIKYDVNCNFPEHNLLALASNRLRTNQDFLLEIVAIDGMELGASSLEALLDEEFMRKAVKINGAVIKYLYSEENGFVEKGKSTIHLRDDEEFLYDAVKTYPQALAYASKRLLADSSFIVNMIKINPQAWFYVPNNIKNNPKEIVKLIKESNIELDKLNKNISNDNNTKNETSLQQIDNNDCSVDFDQDQENE